MGTDTLGILIFGAVIVATLGVTVWAGRRTRTTDQFWAAGRSITPTQNAFAITSDLLSASAFLGTSGLIFLFGYDGLVYLIVPLAAWIPVLLLFAERFRNLGQFTLTDVMTGRFPRRGIRSAVGVATLAITGFYLLAQLVAAGALFQLLAGVPFAVGVVVTGATMLVYVAVGGMLATTWVQVIKALLLVGVLVALSVLLLVRIGGDLGGWPTDAFRPNVVDPAVPGNLLTSGWDTLSVGLALFLGIAALPHVMMRLFTVPDAQAARQSASRAIAIIGSATVMIVFVGLGARTFLGGDYAGLARTGGNLVAPRLGQELAGGAGTVGGTFMLALVAAVALTTITSTTTGLLINASSVVVRDLGRRSGRDGGEVLVARVAAVVIAVLGCVVAVAVGPGLNASVLVTLAFGIAASANFPALALTLFWRRFTATGALAAIYAGLVSAVVLLALGPTLWLGDGESPISLRDPTIVSMPIGFVAGVVGTLIDRRRGDDRFDEQRLRAHLGADPAVPAGTRE